MGPLVDRGQIIGGKSGSRGGPWAAGDRPNVIDDDWEPDLAGLLEHEDHEAQDTEQEGDHEAHGQGQVPDPNHPPLRQIHDVLEHVPDAELWTVECEAQRRWWDCVGGSGEGWCKGTRGKQPPHRSWP